MECGGVVSPVKEEEVVVEEVEEVEVTVRAGPVLYLGSRLSSLFLFKRHPLF